MIWCTKMRIWPSIFVWASFAGVFILSQLDSCDWVSHFWVATWTCFNRPTIRLQDTDHRFQYITLYSYTRNLDGSATFYFWSSSDHADPCGSFAIFWVPPLAVNPEGSEELWTWCSNTNLARVEFSNIVTMGCPSLLGSCLSSLSYCRWSLGFQISLDWFKEKTYKKPCFSPVNLPSNQSMDNQAPKSNMVLPSNWTPLNPLVDHHFHSFSLFVILINVTFWTEYHIIRHTQISLLVIYIYSFMSYKMVLVINFCCILYHNG